MDLKKLYKNVYDPGIILLYKGQVSLELTRLLLDYMDVAVDHMEDDRKVKRKLQNIMVESIQNIGFHGGKEGDTNFSDLIIVLSRKHFYKIITGNLVKTEKVEELGKMIDEVNNLDNQELRELYKQKLNTDGFSDKGTAGLGFVDMARKTGQKLNYKFYEMDEDYSYFSLELKLKKKIQ
jgi:hypothetical protein